MVNKPMLAWLCCLVIVPGLAEEEVGPAPTGPVAQPRRGDEPGTANVEQGVGGAASASDGSLPPVTAPDGGKPAEDKRRKALFIPQDPNTTVRYVRKTGEMVARGKMVMILPDDDVMVYADAIDYTGDEEGRATLTGNLKLVHGPLVMQSGMHAIPEPEDTLTGVIAYIFTKEKRAVVDQEVVLVHTPAEPAPPDADEAVQAEHDETTLYCDRLTYWYRKGARRAFAQPRLPNTQIRFVQQTRRGTAGNARFYDFEEGDNELGDVLDLFGGVYGEDDEGQLIEAEAARIYIDQDESEWYNIKRAVVNLEEEESPPTSPTAADDMPERPGDTPPTSAPAAPPSAAPTSPAPAEPVPAPADGNGE